MFESKQNRVLPATSPVLRPACRLRYCRKTICFFVSIAIIGQIFASWQYYHFTFVHDNVDKYLANSTLGFGRIYAVSRQGSPRQQPLLSAAALTKLDISIPLQPEWTDQDIANIEALENSSMSRGSALAWLGHRNALESFLEDDTETALIIEDDVDWDVRIRALQIPQTAYAIRELLGSHVPNHYYGRPELWDVIWLGHCGDFFNATRGSEISSIKSFKDTAMPDVDKLHPWTRDFLHEIGVHTNQQRLVHVSVRPLCTFAYAVTQAAARRILEEVAVSEPVRDPSRSCGAFDVRLLEGCRDEGLKCITVNPELFHHDDLDSEIARISGNQDLQNPTSNSAMEGSTTNIRCSAKSTKWKGLQNSISDEGLDTGKFIRDLAQLSTSCYIDDL